MCVCVCMCVSVCVCVCVCVCACVCGGVIRATHVHGKWLIPLKPIPGLVLGCSSSFISMSAHIKEEITSIHRLSA